MKRERIDISLVKPNDGQVEGLPRNPRFIKDEKFNKLVESIRRLPEMTEVRDLIVYPYRGEYVVIGGNMRLRAFRELGWDEVPCCVLSEDTPIDKLRQMAIQDNNPFGETDWNMIANEWDVEELKDWGVDLPKEWEGIDEDIENDKSAESLIGHSDKTELRIQFDTDTYATVIETLRSFDEKEDVALLKVLGLYE